MTRGQATTGVLSAFLTSRFLPLTSLVATSPLCVVAFVAATFCAGQAQSVCASDATTETIRIETLTAQTEYRIGDQIEYAITVSCKKPLEMIRIEPNSALGVFEILAAPDVKQKRLKGGWRQERWRFLLSTFETGEFTIPEFTVIYNDADGSEKRIATRPVQVSVKSVVPLRADDTGIRDAKPPVMPPRRLPPRQLLIAVAVALALAVLAAVFAIRAMRKRVGEAGPSLPARPIEEVARERLAQVAQSDLLARGLIKEYFDQVSDVIRAYLGQRYGFEGIVTTTSELLEELSQRTGDQTHLAVVAEFSEEGDLAKFAKWQPDRSVCDRFLETAYRLIEQTTPRAVQGPQTNGQRTMDNGQLTTDNEELLQSAQEN